MPLKLTITSPHKELLGDACVREFGDSGGTIGRSLQNDWVLPDPDKFISGKHATIDCRKGSWYLADVSTNGVYVNDDHEPLGRGNPRRLYDGDRLRMGDFEFTVETDEGEGLEVQAQPLSIVPDDIGLMVPEDPLKTGIQLLDEEEITGDAAFRSTLFGSMPKPVTATAPVAAKPARRAPPKPKPAPRASNPRDTRNLTADKLFDEFLTGLGISRDDIHPSVDPADVMQNAGHVMRELVTGVGELMISRSNAKTMFRLDQTTVLPHHNNPLKLSRNVEDSIKQLLVGQEGEYLGPQDSVREICRDLKFHHDAMMDAMTSAVREFTEHFNPAELQATFERTGSRKPLIDALGKLKFWNMYCDLYPELTEAGDDAIPLQFCEEFVRNYEKCLANLKRVDRKDSEAA